MCIIARICPLIHSNNAIQGSLWTGHKWLIASAADVIHLKLKDQAGCNDQTQSASSVDRVAIQQTSKRFQTQN